MAVSKRLVELKIISGEKTIEVFDAIYADILNINIHNPSSFFIEMWDRFENSHFNSNNLNGAVFESILAAIFYRLGIKPLYVQATVSFVPNVSFDFVGYTREFGPVILSAKTSLRERYKQADLEGMMLRQVHRRAQSYLITADLTAANNVNKKIETGQVLGLDRVIVAGIADFDRLIDKLVGYTYIKPKKIDVIKSNKIIE